MIDQDLFSLAEFNYPEYYVDRDLNVWSTKRKWKKIPKLIFPKWGPKGRYGNTLKGNLMKCDKFVRFLDDNSLQIHTLTSTPVKETSSDKFYVAVLLPDGTPKFSSMPKAHETEESARQECERLAQMNVGTSVAYFRLLGSCVCNHCKWS